MLFNERYIFHFFVHIESMSIGSTRKRTRGGVNTGKSLVEKYTKLPIKKRLSTHDISHTWTEREKTICGDLLLDFLKKKSKVFRTAASHDLTDTIVVEKVKEYEDRLEFTLSPFPTVYSPLFLGDLDEELTKSIPGFSLRLRGDVKKHTFFSPEDKSEAFTATTYTDAFIPCFVYKRVSIGDPYWILFIALIVIIFAGCYFSIFRSIYSEEGYSTASALTEVLKAFF